MTQRPILILFLFCLILASSFSAKGQTIIQDLEFQDIRSFGREYEFVTQGDQGSYLVLVEKQETDEPGMVVGNVLVPAYHHLPNQSSLVLSDMFLCKVTSDYQLVNSLVIDNAEIVRDVFAGSDFTLVSMNLHENDLGADSYPILINGSTEIPREGNIGKGVVIITDNNLEFQRFHIPSSGEIGNVAINGHIAYFELRIPDQQPYIVLENLDTIFNQASLDDPTDFGRQTVVLCSYDLDLNKILWSIRLGNVGYEILDEMLIDNEGNVVILGETSSTYFTFNDQDTIVNMSDHNPFIGKYSSSGELLFSQFNSLENNVSAWDLFIDSENEIYWLGLYRGDQYQTPDTILERPGLGRPFRNQGILTKCGEEGGSSWVMQLEGDFEESIFYSVAELNLENIVISGLFDTGTVSIGDSIYYTEEGASDFYDFIISLDKETGKIKSHSMTRIDKRPLYFYNMFRNNNDQLDIFLYFQGSDTLFQKSLESFDGKISGWLITLSIDFLLRSTELTFVEEMMVYPNPSSQGFYLDATESLTPHPQPFVIFDSVGRKFVTNSIWSGEKKYIDTSDWPVGSYWIQMQIGSQSQTQLVIIQ